MNLCPRAVATSSAIFVLVEHLARIGLGDGVPAFPGDVEDDEGDDEADDRVGEFQSDRDDGGAGEDAEADEAVDAGVLAVGGEGGALQSAPGAQAYLGGEFVADEADHAGGG